MRIHQSVGALVEGGDKRAYIASKSGFLKAVKVGASDKPVHGYFIGKTKIPTSLEAVDPQVLLFDYVPVPAPIIAKATAIFRHVYDNYKGAEMIVFLRWREIEVGEGRKIGRYYLDRADRVEIAAGGLDYVQKVPIVGSLHSHGSFGAGFSSTDDRWERDDAPGVYITVGHVNRDRPSIETSIGGLGARKIIPSPEIPKEVFSAVTVSDEELKWWTETLTVKDYSRSKGFYICIGERVTGWTGYQSKAQLSSGERMVPVQKFHADAKNKKEAQIRKFWDRPLKGNQKGKVTTAVRAGSSAFTLKQYERITNFIEFLKKKDAFEEFMFLLLNQADGIGEDEIIHAVDLHCDREDRRGEEEECGKSLFLGAEGSDTTWPKQWDGYWPE